MNHPQDSTRREFVKQAALGTVALGTVGNLAQQSATAENAAPATRPKSNIRIGVRFNTSWLNSKNDDDLRFFKQIGVNHVDITMRVVKGYQRDGSVTKGNFRDFVKRLDAVGLKIERANTSSSTYLNAHLARPEGQKEIDNLKQIGEMLADAEIPVFGIQACGAHQHVRPSSRGWDRTKLGRGGYGYKEFSIARSKSPTPRPEVLKVSGTPLSLILGGS